MNRRDWAMLVALAIVWGGSFFFNGVAVRDLPAFTLVWLRVAVAAVTLLGVARLTGVRLPPSRDAWTAFAGMAMLNNVLPFVLIVWGQHRIASGLAAILNATTPLFTVLVAHWLTPDERLTPLKLAGVIAGFAGAAVMVGPAALAGRDGGVLRKSLAWAVRCPTPLPEYSGAVSADGRAAARHRDGSGRCLHRAAAAGHAAGGRAMDDLPMPHAATGVPFLVVGMLSTALAYVLYFRILAAAGATNLLLVTFLIPVSAILLGALLLGEVLLARHFLGMALIGAGLACIDGRLPDIRHFIHCAEDCSC